MPPSIAACRTVLPLSTVTCRPSIVSVTFSIWKRSYQFCILHSCIPAFLHSVLPVHVDQRTVVFADLHRTEGALERDAPVGDAVGDGDQDVNRPAVRVLQRHRHGNVEDLARLLEMKDDF